MLKLGVIGFGNRISSIVKLLLETGEVTLTAVADIHIEDAAERVAALADKNSVHYYHDAEEMLNKETLDGICIGTRCSLHQICHACCTIQPTHVSRETGLHQLRRPFQTQNHPSHESQNGGIFPSPYGTDCHLRQRGSGKRKDR